MTYASSTVEPVDRSLRKTLRGEERPTSERSIAVVREIDPLTDVRWDQFVALHPNSSIFHTRAWLEALRRTYGYRPVVYATTRDAQLQEAVVFCKVESRLTGRRLVSLPFSDHCQPLASGAALDAILAYVREEQQKVGLRYVELRPVTCDPQGAGDRGFGLSERVSFQTIDLRPELPVLFKQMHDSCIRRKIKRAEREGLTYEVGRSEELLQKFRQLLFLTRRRHKLPPQPAAWFRNIASSLGESMRVHLLSKDDTPAASILTLHFGQQVTYKYGCSDARFNNLGGTPLLFWRVIQHAKEDGATLLDLGRSDYSDPGLIAFKEHLGGQSTELCYYRTPAPAERAADTGLAKAWAGELLARMPDRLLDATGELLYRHLG
jgi:lipid II:glycine glycyltransferase (peptidoglycan interpeptide bridge formation enzyme)